MAAETLLIRVAEHLTQIYPHVDAEQLALQVVDAIGLTADAEYHPIRESQWDENTCLLITYGDSIKNGDEKPLKTLKTFMDERLNHVFSAVHVLPFFPFSSDDGFSVIDYREVNPELGDWIDLQHIAKDYTLMSDLVINHGSSQSQWFNNFLAGENPGKDYYVTAKEDADVSQVVRPRSSPLLVPYETSDGRQFLWCTFSADQVDFDFSNPRLLLEFIGIIRLYLDNGVNIFRLDAVAFLWKQLGTACVHLPQTHEIIQLLRTLIEHHTPQAMVITETNVPNRENLTYFGNGNEAHMIYNFSLPPLLIYTLLSGDCRHLKTWLLSMPQLPQGNCYFNFIASHDGIGLRPLDGLMSDDERQQLVDTVGRFGGRVTTRRAREGYDKPYELNIALYDACKGTIEGGEDQWQSQRFICAHTIMMALEGMPAFYIHSLLATCNDEERPAQTGQNRSINRHQWEKSDLDKALDDPLSHHNKVFTTLMQRLSIRHQQKAFHPNALQFTMHLGEHVFAFRRQSLHGEQEIIAINNVTDTLMEVGVNAMNLDAGKVWTELLSNKVVDPDAATVVLRPYESLWFSGV